MPLPNLNLDDKTFNELVEEAKKYIPIYAPEWTDHDIHDPGMTLIELFAWISEMQLYYLSKITEENKLNFLKILGDIDENQELDDNNPIDEANFIESSLKKNQELNVAISKTRKDIEKPYSAITPDDYEYLVYEYLESFDELTGKQVKDKFLEDSNTTEKQTKNQFRVKAIPDLNNHIMKVIIVCEGMDEDNSNNNCSNLYNEIYSHLDECRLIGTPLYVGEPEFVEVSISADINEKKDYNVEIVKEKVKNSLNEFLDPFKGGISKKGWPFGRNVFKSEIYRILAKVDGVKSVQNVDIYSSNMKYKYDGEKLSVPDNALIRPKNHYISVSSNNYCKRVDSYE